MCTAMAVGIAGLVLSAATAGYGAYAQTEQQNAAAEAQKRQAQYDASIASQNATRARGDAEVENMRSQENLRNLDRQRTQMRREYTAEQGKNLSLLGASGTDISSGSALDMMTGNADIFSADMGEALRNRSFAAWEGTTKVQNLLHEADIYDSKASYLSSTEANLGNSLLNAGIAAGGSIGAGMFSYGTSKMK